jgi:hypothetical protein
MSDDDVRVDYFCLADSGTALRALKSEFDDLDVRRDDTRGVWGHSGVRQAMDEFAGNMDVHRAQLSAEIQQVGEGIVHALEAFRSVDAELATSFDEERT